MFLFHGSNAKNERLHEVWNKKEKSIWLVEKYLKKNHLCLLNNVCFRYLLSFFDRLAHENTYACIENKHFFTISCHRQTYQNNEQPPQRWQLSDFQTHFSAFKIKGVVHKLCWQDFGFFWPPTYSPALPFSMV